MSKYSLVGLNGNAYCIMGYVTKSMREEGYTKEQIHEYYEKAKSSDYNNLLVVSMSMIDELNKGVVNSNESRNY